MRQYASVRNTHAVMCMPIVPINEDTRCTSRAYFQTDDSGTHRRVIVRVTSTRFDVSHWNRWEITRP